MSRGTEARRLLLSLMAGLALLGCRHTDRPVPEKPRGLPPGAPPPASPLRITEPPAPAAQPAQAAEAPPLPAVPVSEPPPSLPPLPDPSSPARPAEAPLRRLHQAAAREYAGIDSYICRLTRREEVNGKKRPQEIIRFKFRKQPWSAHLAWLDGDGKGREVVYVKGHYDNKLHTLLAAGDMPLARAGTRLSLAPDSVMVRSASRHSITDAGVGSLIDRFGALVEANEKGDKRHGTLTYLGPQKRPEFEAAAEGVEQVIPAGAEKELPRGGRRWWYFDPRRHLPVLVVAVDDRGQEVEYYNNDRFQYPVKLDDDDFNPDRLWPKKGAER
jgi:hypothetical protein